MATKLLSFDTENEWEYENGFYLTSHQTRISKLLAHYELYKSIVNLPGHIVECGVFKGASFVRFCTFRSVLESQYSRKIIGFDAFGKFPVQDSVQDREFAERFESVAGEGASVHELERVLSYKGFDNYELISGNIGQSVPEYARRHPELKIALLHIDVDVYDPSVTVLQELFDKVVRGGLLVLDDYGTVAGETRAIDEFFSAEGPNVEKLPISHIPAFVRKT